MLKQLVIQNLILVERASLSFNAGVTAITGETGSGKTALVEGIRLAMGERADASKVRKGAEKARVEAVFEMPTHPPFFELAEEAGLVIDRAEDLMLVREISAAGKGRAFLNSQIVPAALLQKIAPFLIDFIGQSASIDLKSQEKQRMFLDTYLKLDLTSFQTALEGEKELEKELNALEAAHLQLERLTGKLTAQLEELNEASLEEGEEEELFEEYSLLANATDLLENASAAESRIDPALDQLATLSPHLEKIASYDKTLQEVVEMAKEAHLQLSEIQQRLESFSAKVELDPNRLAFLEERLKLIDRLKKKYGENLLEVQREMQEELKGLESLDERLEEAKNALQRAKSATEQRSRELTVARTDGGMRLAKALTASLRLLNIPSAELTISVTRCTRTQLGEDAVEFYLKANEGEKPSLVRTSTSGGELSRLLFALKLELSKSVQPTVMVFDEIDSNVGGETATTIGQKLKELGETRQILCITHFPQVAKQADTHLSVEKVEERGRTHTQIRPLDARSKEKELLRMLGGAMKQA